MMRKYSTALVAISACVALMGRAEFKLGVIGGGNYSTFSTGVNGSATIASTEYTGRLGPSGMFGYSLGGLVRYEEPVWAIEANLLYTSRSAKWHGNLKSGANSVRNSMQFTLKQIELPVIGFYKMPTQGVADYKFGIGMYVSYGIQKIKVRNKFSDTPGSVVSVDGDLGWDEVGFKRINFGGLMSLGSEFKIGKESRLGVELRAQTTFSGMADTLNPAIGPGGDKIGLLGIDLLVSYPF